MITALQQLMYTAVAIDAEAQKIPALSAEKVVENVLNIFYFIVGATAVVTIIIAGFKYTTSGGDAAAVTKAKNLILYSVVGLIVVLAAFAITNFVTGAL